MTAVAGVWTFARVPAVCLRAALHRRSLDGDAAIDVVWFEPLESVETGALARLGGA